MYVPSANVSTEHQHTIRWLVEITNRNIKKRPMRNGSPLWDSDWVSVLREVIRNAAKRLAGEAEKGGDLLCDVDRFAGVYPG